MGLVKYVEQTACVVPERDPLTQMAVNGRICYGLMDKVDPTNRIAVTAFAQKCLKKRHTTVVEQGSFYVVITGGVGEGWATEVIKEFLYCEQPRYIMWDIVDSGDIIISGNMWALYQLVGMSNQTMPSALWSLLRRYAVVAFPELFKQFENEIVDLIEPVPGAKHLEVAFAHLKLLTVSAKWIAENIRMSIAERHIRIAVKMVSNRAILQQANRHRQTTLMESQRYCDYKTGLFVVDSGKGSIPTKLLKHLFYYGSYMLYAYLRRFHAPQVAREVLPMATGSQQIMTMTIEMWKHFIKLRTSAAADPMIRDLAMQIYASLKQSQFGIMFDNNYY